MGKTVQSGKDLLFEITFKGRFDADTVSEKEFVRIENIGRIHRYHPAVSKDQYSKNTLTNVTKEYFDGSFSNVVSFLVDENKLSVKDLELLLKQLKKTNK